MKIREEKAEIATPPVVFLCHASEDNDIVQDFANDLMSRGINVFFDEWEIGPSDSIRRKIDQGLEECTHFIAILTPASIGKEWVNTEIDAAFIQKIEGQVRFIPLRVGLPIQKLSPLLRSLHSPEITNYGADVEKLASHLHGISEKPPLGPIPKVILQRTPELGLSAAAEAIVRLMVEKSTHACSMDPQLEPDEIRQFTRLVDEDIIDGIDELQEQGFVRRHTTLGCGTIGFRSLTPESELFVKFDSHFKPWNPESDALRIAADLVNGSKDGVSIVNLATSYEWPPRRMNPAISYLNNRHLVMVGEMLSYPWTTAWIRRTPESRRFVRDRS
ncbi:toll/interleukin-1 receptor domain-containing protein [Desulforhabdus sp. TSK]|uniref:toll/interleukin-1 receptor domain-containing protein n=1 Tax=Desulforhabdus sp. TSK TaxID=2925014 RepID=UPI001FC8E44E|nr:toll/interleukin-1 receptor domain-containing protein [Desulforhabdus sp. TSK]GKT09784.1 hypothetical protein DSTSK_30890 [Desulforhabdus sp. TSK]